MSQRLNLLAPEVRENPYPFYAQLRRESPVCQVEPGGMWAVSRYDDVIEVLKSPRLFSSEGLRISFDPPWIEHSNFVAESILVMDPPRHTRLRALVSRAFGNTALARLEPLIRQVSAQLCDEFLERGTADFVSDFALRLPAHIVGNLLGLDPSLYRRFKQWSDDIAAVAAVAPDDLDRQTKLRQNLMEMRHYMEEVIADRRRKPGEDMVTDLLQSQAGEDGLTDVELMGFLFLLLAAGLETTGHTLSHTMLALTEFPELLGRLKAEPGLIPQFIEEVMRWEPPTQVTVRLTTQEVVLRGVKLPALAPVAVILASAVRDENQYPNADRFDIDRGAQANAVFGHGIHFCLGAPLARLQVRLAMEALLPRCRSLSRLEKRVQWNYSLNVRGPVVLPVQVHPA